MSAPAPAVERAAREIYGEWENEYSGDYPWPAWESDENLSRDTARTWATNTLAAALTDPDDPDSLARTLFVLHSMARGYTEDQAAEIWSLEVREASRIHWRAVADGLRMMLTGSGS